MNIDEAIKHAEEQADKPNISYDCACEHRQLAKWLRKKKALNEERMFIIFIGVVEIVGIFAALTMWHV